ncbi:nicotinamide riboside transporter PnuC [Palleniella muris]|uniref:Nicotinamide riboside transporter PnuC n=1 Tax=Palleniella muris TaxID=3038145 RepID=A0AC61QM24_9BACT|nr:nicotinamide riboside transporter PnuC [Palleniella muris]TGX80160.1 nicotinamide riboside transporter PnuC [Palleniella muris]
MTEYLANNWMDVLGTTLGLLYLYLELKENILMWITGAIMPVVYTVVLYRAGVYADCGMEFYYFLAAIYGFYSWRRRKSGNKAKATAIAISHTPLSTVYVLMPLTAALWAALWAFLHFCTDSNVPVLDSLTTAFSIIGLWMLSRKYIEQWWVWLVVDAISSALYIYKGIYARALLYAIYTVIAVYGYYAWRRRMKNAV